MEAVRQPAPSAANPEIDCSDALKTGVAILFAQMGLASAFEIPLANGRRADVMGLGRKGEIWIAEVKSGVADFRADGKWPEYQPYCDRFFFAVGERFPREILPAEPGLIVADGYGGAILRQGPETRLVPARRKAVTLLFARIAARRLLHAGADLNPEDEAD